MEPAARCSDCARRGEDVSAQEIYFTRNMQNHHGGVVLVDGYLYGFNNSILTCLEFETGKVMWRDRSVGKGSVAYADGRLYVLSEDNVVGLVEASPKGYRETGRFSIADQGWPSWAHPVDQRWTALHAKPERARQLRGAGEVKRSGWWLVVRWLVEEMIA